MPEEIIQPPLQLCKADPETACRLLAAAYHAIAHEVPFVIAAPEHLFAGDAPVQAWFDFLRMALPSAWSEVTLVEPFTFQPFPLLEAGTAPLLGIPATLARALLGARRDAILLNELGEQASGAKPESLYLSYADHVVRFLLDQPVERIGDLRNRIALLLPQAQAPEPEAIEALTLVVSLASGSPLEWPADTLHLDARRILTSADVSGLLPSGIYSSLRRRGTFHESLRTVLLAELETRSSLESPLTPEEWDSWVAEDPITAVSTMLSSGQWTKWRDGTRLDPSSLQDAALAWYQNAYWKKHEPFLEDWVLVLRDLSSFNEAEALVSFPRIEFLENDQRRMLAERTATMAVPAVPPHAERVQHPPPEPEYRSLLRRVWPWSRNADD